MVGQVEEQMYGKQGCMVGCLLVVLGEVRLLRMLAGDLFAGVLKLEDIDKEF